MRYVILLGIVAMLLFGCINIPLTQQPSPSPAAPNKTCSLVSEQVPAQVPECDNVSITEQVCGVRALPYDSHEITKLDLCIQDGPCVGKALGDCPSCTLAMTRCGILVTNLDKKSEGTWTVTANFTVSGGGFNANPVSRVLRPNESFEFDFQQMYTPGSPINSAFCSVALLGTATVDDCHDETRMKEDCKNVTEYVTVQRQVCS